MSDTIKRSEAYHRECKRASKHRGGKQRPHDFDAKRKVRRQMAKASRRINRQH